MLSQRAPAAAAPSDNAAAYAHASAHVHTNGHTSAVVCILYAGIRCVCVPVDADRLVPMPRLCTCSSVGTLRQLNTLPHNANEYGQTGV